ncbi:MAG: hypothetical protein HJJLKODD_00728 [Phycisphaerae bacterium]|nr:hypothetical protein [Phycisphaerae bacterium]
MADKKSFLLRLPPDLWEALNRLAQDELRSLNGQIEFILREAVRNRHKIENEKSEEDSQTHNNRGQ